MRLRALTFGFLIVLVTGTDTAASTEITSNSRLRTLWAGLDFGIAYSRYEHEQNLLQEINRSQLEIPVSFDLGLWATDNLSIFTTSTTMLNTPREYGSIEMKQKRQQFGGGIGLRDCFANMGCSAAIAFVSYNVELSKPFSGTNAYVYETRMGVVALVRLTYLLEIAGNIQVTLTPFFGAAYIPNRSESTYTILPAGDAGRVTNFQFGFAIGVGYNR